MLTATSTLSFLRMAALFAWALSTWLPAQARVVMQEGSVLSFGQMGCQIWSTQMSCDGQVAMGFIRVANETMCRPIRALTQMRGYDVAQHVLACFGGAGGQHACAIARSLGMKTIFVHHFSGILSAVGIGLADVVVEEQVLGGPMLSS